MIRMGVVLCLLSGLARADEDKELARQRFRTGQALFQRGRVAEALHEFEEGKKSFLLPEFDYNIGLSLAKLNRPSEAADALQRYMDAKPDDPEAAGIWKMIAELRAEAARHQVPPSPEPKANPQLQLTAPTPPPPQQPVPRDDGRRTAFTRAAIATVTIGGAMLLAGAITGGVALRSKNDYEGGCERGRCVDADYERAHRLALGTDFLLPLGAALVVTSIVLFAKRPPAAARVAWSLSF